MTEERNTNPAQVPPVHRARRTDCSCDQGDPPSEAERATSGKAARTRAPWPGRPTSMSANAPTLALLATQAASRVPDLVPIRYGRMSSSPFAFYRGAALLMASDLASTPNSGLNVQLCGDAPPQQLRHLRLTRTPAGVRHQRLRRDAPWPLRVGRQAPGRQSRGRGGGPMASPRRSDAPP